MPRFSNSTVSLWILTVLILATVTYVWFAGMQSRPRLRQEGFQDSVPVLIPVQISASDATILEPATLDDIKAEFYAIRTILSDRSTVLRTQKADYLQGIINGVKAVGGLSDNDQSKQDVAIWAYSKYKYKNTSFNTANLLPPATLTTEQQTAMDKRKALAAADFRYVTPDTDKTEPGVTKYSKLLKEFLSYISTSNETTTTVTNAIARTEFWKIVEILNGADLEKAKSMNDIVNGVAMPSGSDLYKVVFPRYVAIWAYAKFRNTGFTLDDILPPAKPTAVQNAAILERQGKARAKLMSDYNTLQAELTTNIYVAPVSDGTYLTDSNGKTQRPSEASTTCTQLSLMKTEFESQKTRLKARVTEINDSLNKAGQMRDENYAFQTAYTGDCAGQNRPPGCIPLASRDDDLITLLPAYDNAAQRLFESEIQITETLNVVNYVYSLVGCNNPGTMELDLKKEDIMIDIYTLRNKIQQLSPYFVSNGVKDFITTRLPSTQRLSSEIDSNSNIALRTTKMMEEIQSMMG